MVRPSVPIRHADLELLDSDWARRATDSEGPPGPRFRRSLSACARLGPASRPAPPEPAESVACAQTYKGLSSLAGSTGSGPSESMLPSQAAVPVLRRPADSSAAASSALLGRAHSSPGEVSESPDDHASAPAAPDWADAA